MATKITQIMSATDGWYAELDSAGTLDLIPVVGWALAEYGNDKVITALIPDMETGRLSLVGDLKNFKGLRRVDVIDGTVPAETLKKARQKGIERAHKGVRPVF